MRFLAVPACMRRPYYQGVFKGGPLDGVAFEWEGLMPPDSQWVQIWNSMEAFVGMGTRGPGYIPGPDGEDDGNERALYHIESRTPFAMLNDRPQWRYIFAGIAKAPGKSA